MAFPLPLLNGNRKEINIKGKKNTLDNPVEHYRCRDGNEQVNDMRMAEMESVIEKMNNGGDRNGF